MRSKLVAVGAIVAGITLGAAGSAVGGQDPPPLTVSPESGAPGSTFTVSGEDCFFEQNNLVNGNVGPLVEVTVDFPTPLVDDTNADLETGEWSVTFTVPDGTPPGTYDVSATCFNTPVNGEVSAADFDYPAGAVFTVGAETPVAPVVPPAPTEAAPAPAVAGAPRLTG